MSETSFDALPHEQVVARAARQAVVTPSAKTGVPDGLSTQVFAPEAGVAS